MVAAAKGCVALGDGYENARMAHALESQGTVHLISVARMQALPFVSIASVWDTG